MQGLIILIILVGVGVGVLAIFVIRTIIMPKRISTVQNLIKQNRLTAAAKTVKAILIKEPKNSVAHYYMAKIYLAEQKAELALMELKTVNAIGQFDYDIPEKEFRILIASLYERFGQAEEALKEYIMLSQKDPNNAEYFYQCGRIFGDRGKTEVAVKYVRKAIELDPKHGKAHFTLGMILYRTKHPVEARTEFEAALKHDPTNYESYYYLGKLLKENNDTTGALLAFERAQKSPGYKLKALVERGATYINQGSFENAIIELERAIKMSKDDAQNETIYARYFLAACYEKLKNLDKAIENWEKIYVRKPQFRDVAEKLGQYQEYRTDDRMKDFLICNQDEFIKTCKEVAAKALTLAVHDTLEIPNGVEFIAVEGEQDKWLGAKKMPKLVRFLRVADTIDESAIRSLLEAMKKKNIIRGVLVTSSTFTRTALDFAENRPVELYNKEHLQEFLKKI
ncbi:MAG: tetratricopeptide repeat protein [Spirochaetes bacterium]|nr:tetratricopeptide repeat protein [Spirochaetota bacterium]MBU0955812.1 tetratricopeptide repeat protein [Spirochaetota bacterium]